ncbi:MAG: hypothetical protein V2J08_01665 [Desulfotignum sp.]|jgi:hypothetical protein|nr:hypothetical protein [Desulfotignum sp.]
MKITDPQVIKNGENDLIASVQKNLDQEIIKKIIADQMARTALVSKGGQIVVHDNQVAFRMDFDLQLSGSLLFDRQGNYIADVPEPRTDSKDSESVTASLETQDPEQLQPDAEEDLARADLDREPEEESDSSSLEAVETEMDDALDDLDDTDTGDTDFSRDDLDDDSLEIGTLELEEDRDENDVLDDDIDDILKESREFWEEKKGS